MRSRRGLGRSLPLPSAGRFTPYAFRGMAIAVQSIQCPEINSLGNIDDVEKIQTVLNNHLEICRVMGIVRITQQGYLVSDNLEDPEAVPWFLIRGKYHTIDRYLIANEADAYYPVEILNSSLGNTASPIPKYHLMPKTFHQQDMSGGGIYDWGQFSNIDKQLVTEAITTFLRTEFN